jgi:cellulose synthase/poly-beta-1,6-N-acetylglucosamine synthase-like glycosyltransferase
MNKVLCSVATRGRYHTTLPLVLNAIINQTRPVDKLVIFDDNDEPKDMRKEMIYSYFFQMLNAKGIEWEWLFAEKKGQHHIHQRANLMGYDLVWRCDDDAIPEPNVLENLINHFNRRVGAVGGSVLTPPYMPDTSSSTGRIDDIDKEPNIQWGMIDASRNVDHLHCTFLYRPGIVDYNLGLSRVAHREETLFTYGLAQKGWQIKVVPNAVTWHMKNPEGGIRSETKQEMYQHDERIFRNILEYRDKTIVVLNCGLGDHVVFSHVLPSIPNAEVFTCYPEVVPGRSIAEAEYLFGDLGAYNVYQKMDQWRWKDSLESAYRKLYL